MVTFNGPGRAKFEVYRDPLKEHGFNTATILSMVIGFLTLIVAVLAAYFAYRAIPVGH